MNNNFRRKGYSKVLDEQESCSLLEPEPDHIPLSDLATPVRGNLHPKKREDDSPVRPKLDQTIDHEIQPDDTLRTVSLKYNVQVAELKRVNNILNEAEFFALQRIKIPVKPNSLLAGVHSEQKKNGNGWLVDHRDGSSNAMSSRSSGLSSPRSSPCSELDNSPSSSSRSVHLKTVSLGETVFSESKDKKKAKRFLKEMDKDLQRIREKQRSLNTLEEELKDNTETRIYPLRASHFQQDNTGCSNRTLACWCGIVTVLIVIVFCVLVSLMHVHHDVSVEEFEKWEHEGEKVVKKVMDG